MERGNDVMRFSPRLLARVVPILVVLVLLGLRLWPNLHAPPTSSSVPPAGPADPTTINTALLAAARAHQSHVEVEARGRVTRLLPDDTEGARHQRFLVRIADGLTILVAYNRDLASPIPLQLGDSVALRGEYIWNERGGMIHWTHHDPAQRHEPGWIEYHGRRYD
jgi:hypothetical protein